MSDLEVFVILLGFSTVCVLMWLSALMALGIIEDEHKNKPFKERINCYLEDCIEDLLYR